MLFFGIEETTPSHIALRIFGIRLNLLRPEIKLERKELNKYYHSFSSASEIPPAKGSIRLIQLANAGFLKEFEEFLNKYNLKYWIDFGTLLGAIRHKGFIPWDDDLDIAMLRDDYEKLIDIFKNNDLSNLNFQLVFENNKRNKCYVKIKCKNSKNLFIDIFPYDLYHSKTNDEDKKVLSSKISEITKKKPLIPYKSVEDIKNRFSFLTKNVISDNKTADIKDEPSIFMGIDFPHKWQNKVYDFEDIFPLIEIQFENQTFFAPNKPEKVLKSIYKDYMNIPDGAYPRHSNYLNINDEEKQLLEGYIK